MGTGEYRHGRVSRREAIHDAYSHGGCFGRWADGSYLLYEDDGKSFNYRKGEWMGMDMRWNDRTQVLSLQLALGSKMLAPAKRNLEVKVAGQSNTAVFEGRPLEVRF